MVILCLVLLALDLPISHLSDGFAVVALNVMPRQLLHRCGYLSLHTLKLSCRFLKGCTTLNWRIRWYDSIVKPLIDFKALHVVIWSTNPSFQLLLGQTCRAPRFRQLMLYWVITLNLHWHNFIKLLICNHQMNFPALMR